MPPPGRPDAQPERVQLLGHRRVWLELWLVLWLELWLVLSSEETSRSSLITNVYVNVNSVHIVLSERTNTRDVTFVFTATPEQLVISPRAALL